MIKRINIQQIVLSLAVCQVLGDEFLSWVIMIYDLKILSLLLFLLSSMTIKSIMTILMSNIRVFDEFWHVKELGFMRVSCSRVIKVD